MKNTTDMEFTPIIGALLKYGQLVLETDFSEYAAELAEELQMLATDAAEDAAVQADLDSLQDAVDGACAFWQSEPQLVLHADDALWDEAIHTLHIFDFSNYLEQALFALKDRLPNALYARVSAASDLLSDKLELFLNDAPELSLLRLTPLNSYRRWKMEHLPAATRDFYPWYAIWSDLPETFLAELGEHWAAIRGGDFSAPALPDSCPPALLIEELHADAALRQAIGNWHQERLALQAVLAQAVDQRLWYLSEDAALDNPLPEGLEEKGLVRLALAALDTGAARTATPDKHDWRADDYEAALDTSVPRTEKLARIFWTAFCATGLSDGQRLSCFGWVLNHLNIAPVDAEQSVYLNVLHHLQQWRSGAMAGDRFANTIYQRWNEHLLKVAENVPDHAEDMDPRWLWNKLTDIRAEVDKGSPISMATAAIKLIGRRVAELIAAVRRADEPFDVPCHTVAYAGDESSDGPEMTAISYDDWPACLPLEPIDGYIQLPGALPEACQHIVDQATDRFIWGLAWNGAGEYQEIDFDGQSFMEIDEQFNGHPVEEILLLLVFDEVLLAEAADALRAWADNPQAALPKLEKTIYLRYSATAAAPE